MLDRRTIVMLTLIIIGVIAGAMVGYFWGEDARKVAWLGDLFLRTLSMLVIPLLISAVITGITSLGDVRRLGRIGGITIAYYFITGAIAVLIGLIVVNVLEPGVGVSTARAVSPDEALRAAEDLSFTDIVLSLVHPNLIAAAAGTQLLPLILWSIAFGIALSTIGRRGRAASQFFDSFSEGMMRLVTWVMYFAPIGIFGLVAGMLGKAGGGAAFWTQLQAVGMYVVTVLSGLAIHFAVLTLILVFIAKRNPAYLVGMLRALFTALATASSTATLPLTMQCAKENNVDSRARRFVLPLGSTVNMDGTALYEAAAAMFIAQAYGIHMGFAQQSMIFLTATLAAIGAAGIPEAGLVTMIIVLQAVGLPLEGIGLLLSVDWFLDRFRTTTNVWGDAVGAAVVHNYLPRTRE